MERCELTDLYKDQCAHCLGHLTPEEEEYEDNVKFLDNLKDFTNG